jgi:hypothetical protein
VIRVDAGPPLPAVLLTARRHGLLLGAIRPQRPRRPQPAPTSGRGDARASRRFLPNRADQR